MDHDHDQFPFLRAGVEYPPVLRGPPAVPSPVKENTALQLSEHRIRRFISEVIRSKVHPTPCHLGKP